MGRVLVIVGLVIFVAWWLFGRQRKVDPPAGGDAAAPGPGAAKPAPQAMVACAHCGVHLPRADAVVDGTSPAEAVYCGEAHRRLGPRHP